MKIKELKHMIDSLPSPEQHPTEYIQLEYFPSFVRPPLNKNELWSEPIKTFTVVFRRVHTIYGFDWELMDVNILIKTS